MKPYYTNLRYFRYFNDIEVYLPKSSLADFTKARLSWDRFLKRKGAIYTNGNSMHWNLPFIDELAMDNLKYRERFEYFL